MTEDRILVLFTLTFPFGSGEEFIEREIEIASEYYSEIYVVPGTIQGAMRQIPQNAVILYDIATADPVKARLFSAFIAAFAKDVFLESNFFRKIRSTKTYFRYFRDQFRRYLAIESIYSRLNGKGTTLIFYDFWMINNGLALSILNARENISIYSNAHSYDLYDERWGCPLPFRSLIIKSLKKVFPDSAYGMRYLKSKISPALHEKVELSYMGTDDFGMGPIPVPGKILIVSCCTCAAHKRVDRIVEALSTLDNEGIEWVHFGEGPLFEQIKALAADKLVKTKYEFKGWVTSDTLNNFFRSNPINVFLHASEAEGVPVSLMIAASYGIPIIAHDAMGVGELVRPGHGCLLPTDATIESFAQVINDSVAARSCDVDYRQASRIHWRECFSLDNYHLLHRDKIRD